MSDHQEPHHTDLIGSSDAMQRLCKTLQSVAATDAPVFLSGESGTGKDHAAWVIHQASTRKDRSFVTLNCAGLPDDILDRELFGPTDDVATPAYRMVPRYLSKAQGGTLYLDDVLRATPQFQSRLLRLLTTQQFIDQTGQTVDLDVRLMSGSNSNVSDILQSGQFRRELYDRIALVPVTLPPLRDRDNDASEIARWAFARAREESRLPKATLSDNVCAQIVRHPWPGNVRQLLNVVKRMALTGDPASNVEPQLPPDVLAEIKGVQHPSAGPVTGLPEGMEMMTFAQIERRIITSVIDRHDGSIQKASEQLDLAASTIYRKMKQWQDQKF